MTAAVVSRDEESEPPSTSGISEETDTAIKLGHYGITDTETSYSYSSSQEHWDEEDEPPAYISPDQLHTNYPQTPTTIISDKDTGKELGRTCFVMEHLAPKAEPEELSTDELALGSSAFSLSQLVLDMIDDVVDEEGV